MPEKELKSMSDVTEEHFPEESPAEDEDFTFDD
jgi:hypothetical protein